MEQYTASQASEKHFSLQRIRMLLYVALFSGIVFGLIGYFIGKESTIYEQKQNTIVQSVPSTEFSKITPKQANNPYAGWKQYCSKLEKSCFMYPPNWHIETEEFLNPADYALLTSPIGDHISFDSPANGLDDNGCSPTQHAFIHKVIPNHNVANLYIVEYSNQNNVNEIALINDENDLPNGNIGKPPVIGDTGQCVLEPIFRSRNVPEDEYYQTVSSFNSFSIKQSDLPIAELILESYTY